MTKGLTTGEFVEKAKKIHGDKYTYEKVVYENNSTKVIITCGLADHGDFSSTPNSHLAGSGCPKCGKIKNNENRRFTKEKFIAKCKGVHGDTYIYDHVIYEGCHDKVKIECKNHGIFEQFAYVHLQGCGCPKCCHKFTDSEKEHFFNKCKKIHNNIYNYEKSIYENALTKMIIICPKHGSFERTPVSHEKGSGCHECNRVKLIERLSSNTEEFILKSNTIHNNKYNYDKVDYEHNALPITITCELLDHGDFVMLPRNHLVGHGCPKCGIIKWTKSTTLTLDEFILKSNKVHNNKYIYDAVVYENSYTKVKIECKIHGIFEQLPPGHTRGLGCNKCAHIYDETQKEIFFNKCREKHDNYYKYDISIYIDGNTHMNIICPKHGEFKQIPSAHIRGQGCPKCACSCYSKGQIEWLNYLSNHLNLSIQHTFNGGEHKIRNSRYRADGYNKDLNLIFEFLGCYYHFCKKCFNGKENDINKTCKKTFQELHDKTIKRTTHCLKEGYKYIEIWECDWKKIKDSPELSKNYIDNLMKELLIVPKCENIIEQRYNEVVLKTNIIEAQTKYITEKYKTIMAN